MKLKHLALVCAATFALSACGGGGEQAAPEQTAAPPAAKEKTLHVYNWSDYIAEDTLDNFQKETGIKVVYDVFDSNEVLEAKLVAGSTGYDVVVPSLSFLGRQIQAGVFQPLDKARLKNYGNLDEELLQRIATTDPDNAHAIPYLWGTTGIGYNVAKVKEALGDDVEIDSWDIVFKPENIAKLHACGVAVLDTPQEMIPTALNYLGEDPNSFDEAVIEKGVALLESIRPHITYFHSSQYINDLANGDICLAVGWSGDVLQAAGRAEEAENGVEVGYVIPKEGAAMWFDMLAMPKDAKNVDEAYQFLDYLMRPEVMAGIQNYVAYASGNKAAMPMVDEEIRTDPGVYPTEEAKAKLFTFKVVPPDVDRIYSRSWTRLKTGQ
ncbi:MAG: extracellular solute-binding protein [Xanthomonadales bacterium]|nr:extracellular solute-binding protein [Xanthomonadales bacterium]